MQTFYLNVLFKRFLFQFKFYIQYFNHKFIMTTQKGFRFLDKLNFLMWFQVSHLRFFCYKFKMSSQKSFRNSVWSETNRKSLIIIRIWFNSTRCRKKNSVCIAFICLFSNPHKHVSDATELYLFLNIRKPVIYFKLLPCMGPFRIPVGSKTKGKF